MSFSDETNAALPPQGAENVPGSVAERLSFERLLTDLSSRFVNLPAEKIDGEIVNGFEKIAKTLSIDRCSIAEFTEDKKALRVTHAFSMEGVTPMPDITINEQVPWFNQCLHRGETVVFSSPSDLPPEAETERDYSISQGIQSALLIPLGVGGNFLGVLGFAALTSKRSWPQPLVQRLKLLGEIFANVLMRKESDQQLRHALVEIKRLKDRLEAENTFLRTEISQKYSHERFIGNSKMMRELLSRAEQVAKTDSTVLIMGETGTGKELLAYEIHHLSNRGGAPMITVNCAALPSNLVESELFGHEKGAYTGAQSLRLGRFELADGSTIFLDEIGELSLELQAKLLRVLQMKQFERLGGNKTVRTNARVIAATNRDLEKSVESGEFRMDLYYRLNVFPLVIPPLRARTDDIPELVWFFVNDFSEKMGKPIDHVPAETMAALKAYPWPGNVRELRNILERAMIISEGKTLSIDLPSTTRPLIPQSATLDQLQKRHILETLEKTKWRIRGKSGAAEILGMKPTTLESRMHKLGIYRNTGGPIGDAS
jgi:formate hydrogenlyase transcriptional activator